MCNNFLTKKKYRETSETFKIQNSKMEDIFMSRNWFPLQKLTFEWKYFYRLFMQFKTLNLILIY